MGDGECVIGIHNSQCRVSHVLGWDIHMQITSQQTTKIYIYLKRSVWSNQRCDILNHTKQ